MSNEPRKPPDRDRRPGCSPSVLLAIAAVAGGLIVRRLSHHDGENLPDRRSLAAGHEIKDMRPSQVVLYLGTLIIAIGLLVAVVTGLEWLILGHLGSIQAVVANPLNVPMPPAPNLETGNGQVLEQLRAKEDQLLNGYSWIDQSKGIVRIPIDRAIELTAKRGLPTRSQPSGQAQNALTRPAVSSSGRTLEKIP